MPAELPCHGRVHDALVEPAGREGAAAVELDGEREDRSQAGRVRAVLEGGTEDDADRRRLLWGGRWLIEPVQEVGDRSLPGCVEGMDADVLARTVFQVEHAQGGGVPAAVPAHGEGDRRRQEPFGPGGQRGEVDPRAAGDPEQPRVAQAPVETTALDGSRTGGGGGHRRQEIAGPVQHRPGDA
ncbi:hypothetical protein [Streptomyces olindensis]|uniref:hypothetical protein n=1 Tax=Streptomyces olindensis TaxID=358823 RepID=UPI003665A14B